MKFLNRLRDITAESGCIPKGAFARWAMQLLPLTVHQGNAEMYHRSVFLFFLLGAGHLTGAGFALQCWLCSASADVMTGHV